MMNWIANELQEWAACCFQGALWALLFWGSHEYLGFDWPKVGLAIVYLAMAGVLAIAGAGLTLIAARRGMRRVRESGR